MATEVIYPRLSKGSRFQDAYPPPSLRPSLASLDSAFQLQEYISLLIRLDVHDVEGIVSLPGKAENDVDSKDNEEDKAVDEACWIYEQLRRIALDLTYPLITTLQVECSRASCPEMKAGEWLYLCVAHGGGGTMEQCCAIDYIVHTLDSATALLNSPRVFPSRISVPSTSHRHFSSLARRLSRIFLHAYDHHREIFEQSEAESSLYARFLALSRKFNLVPPEFLVVPTPSPTHPEEASGRPRQRPRTDTMYTLAQGTEEQAEAAVEKEEEKEAEAEAEEEERLSEDSWEDLDLQPQTQHVAEAPVSATVPPPHIEERETPAPPVAVEHTPEPTHVEPKAAEVPEAHNTPLPALTSDEVADPPSAPALASTETEAATPEAEEEKAGEDADIPDIPDVDIEQPETSKVVEEAKTPEEPKAEEHEAKGEIQITETVTEEVEHVKEEHGEGDHATIPDAS